MIHNIYNHTDVSFHNKNNSAITLETKYGNGRLIIVYNHINA